MLGDLEETKYPSFPFVTNLRIIIMYFLTAQFECFFKCSWSDSSSNNNNNSTSGSINNNNNSNSIRNSRSFLSDGGGTKPAPSVGFADFSLYPDRQPFSLQPVPRQVAIQSSACTQTGSHLVFTLYPDRQPFSLQPVYCTDRQPFSLQPVYRQVAI